MVDLSDIQIIQDTERGQTMKKSSLAGLMPGGAELVIMDAKFRASRGKSPVMPYAGEFNPRKALQKAKEAIKRVLAMISENDSSVRWLESMRRSGQQNNYTDYVREDVKKARLTLADIGTSEEELEELAKNAYRNHAVMWLEMMRKPDQDTDLAGYLRDDVKRAGITLARIGTSDEELKKLTRVAHRNDAIKWLNYQRCPGEKSDFTSYIRDSAKKAKVSLANIGTSDEELKKLASAAKTAKC